MNNLNKNTARMTVNSKGQIVPMSVGISRWANPRKYTCGHYGCTVQAVITARSDVHTVLLENGEAVNKTHNCCKSDHEVS